MKGLINTVTSRLFLIAFFSFAALAVNAQVYVSKGVQKYANKSAYETTEKNTQLRSVETPSVAVSKGVHQIGESTTEIEKGNIISKGYPYWTITKGVSHQHKRAELDTEYISRNK
jgi:hypothetical protein